MPTAPGLPDEVRNSDERETLEAMLDFYRAVMVRKVWGLSPEQLQQTIAPSALTLGGLLKHMAWVESIWFSTRFAGRDPREPWASAPWEHDGDWEFTSATGATVDELVALFEGEVAEARRIVAASPSLDTVSPHRLRDGGTYNLRWVLVHMIEEYARHCGHADLIREAIDGATGD